MTAERFLLALRRRFNGVARSTVSAGCVVLNAALQGGRV